MVVLLAFGIVGINARSANFIDDLYREHNKYRNQNGLNSLQKDLNMQFLLIQLQLDGVTYEVGHDHAQAQALEGKEIE